jgi:tetratricopeptide (TPR) repeat protein
VSRKKRQFVVYITDNSFTCSRLLIFIKGIQEIRIMGLGQKINNLLDYKINIDLNARLSREKAYRILGMVTVVTIISGYIIGEAFFWGLDRRGVFDRQIEVLEKASENPDNLHSKADLALAYYMKGETGKAQGLYEDVLRQDIEHAVANIYYGLILADQKQYRDAVPYLLRGVRKEPRRENLAYIYLGISYYELGGNDQAVQYLETGTKLDPGSALGHYYLGLAYKNRGDKKNAAAALEKALILTGNNYPEAAGALKGLTGIKNDN